MAQCQCPGCGYLINLKEGVNVGARTGCPECGELLEVISLKPLELDYAFSDEDWEEEEEEV